MDKPEITPRIPKGVLKRLRHNSNDKNTHNARGTSSLNVRLSFLANCVRMTTSLTCALVWNTPRGSQHKAQLCWPILYPIIKIWTRGPMILILHRVEIKICQKPVLVMGASTWCMLLMLWLVRKTITTTFRSKIWRKNPTAHGFLFLNLPKITMIHFFFCKCGHKHWWSDDYSHNHRLSDGALV